MNTPIVVKYPSSRMEIPFAESYSESNHRWRYEFHRSKITRCIQPDTSLFGSSQESPISSEYAWAVILCIAQRSGGRHYSLSAPYAVHRQPVLSIRSSFESNNNVLTITERFWYLGEATKKKILRTCLFQPINMYESMNILKYNTWNKLNCLSYFHRCIFCSSHHTNVNYLFRARPLFHWTLFWLLTTNQQSWRLFYSSFRWSLVQVTPSGGLYIGNPQTPNHIPSTSEKSIEWNTRFNVVLEKWGLFKVLITRVRSELACMHVKPKCLLGAYAGFIRIHNCYTWFARFRGDSEVK